MRNTVHSVIIKKPHSFGTPMTFKLDPTINKKKKKTQKKTQFESGGWIAMRGAPLEEMGRKKAHTSVWNRESEGGRVKMV